MEQHPGWRHPQQPHASGMGASDEILVLRVDQRECVCLKFLVLCSLDVRDLENSQLVRGDQEQVSAALLAYTLCSCLQQMARFGQLLL